MPALREALSSFADALSAPGDDDKFLSLLAGPRTSAQRGLAAYRQAVTSNRVGALRATYPIVEAIVGTEFFDGAARIFAGRTPSRSGDLNEYGEAFADFLSDFAPAADLPYLPDVARLEWLAQTVYFAADGPALDLAALVHLAPEDWAQAVVELAPAHGLLASPWPVADIWRVNQLDYAGELAVDFSRGQRALILRRVGVVQVEALPPGEFALVRSLAAGESLLAAVEKSVAEDPAFDLAASLQRFVATGLLRRVHF